MSLEPDWERVYTIVLYPFNEDAPEKSLAEFSTADHLVLRVPFHCQETFGDSDMLRNEYAIQRAIRRIMEAHDIDPDVYHIRFSNNASRAVACLAKALGKKLVFTLTSDPHIKFSDTRGRLYSFSVDEALSNLNKVYISDSILEEADGILGIGFPSAKSNLLSYFPQLWLHPELQGKPFKMISEGISLDEGTSPPNYPELLFNHAGKYHLDRSPVPRPVIFNVGRLRPEKGQHLLLEAWASSGLSEIYDLVFVGGNFTAPDKIEQQMLDTIDQIMAAHPGKIGRFCHLPALSNSEVRDLGRGINRQLHSNRPQVYTCSSIKEEFGIAIVEAMAAGFL